MENNINKYPEAIIYRIDKHLTRNTSANVNKKNI